VILITGGMGFIGLHTAKRFLDNGESVVLTQHRAQREPEFLREQVGKRVFIEQVDVTNGSEVGEALRKHKADRIVHLVAPPIRGMSPSDEYRLNTLGLLNVLEAAKANDVGRTAVISSSFVYLGVPQGPYSEAQPLPFESRNSTEAYKKAMEIMALHYASRVGLNVVVIRPGHIYGPLYYSMFNLPGRLCHAAVRGTRPDFSDLPAGTPFDGDEGDFCYVKDCAKGIQLLTMAPSLKYSTYNVGGGRAVTNADIANAVSKAVPSARFDLRPGRSPQARNNPTMDISRAMQDAAYEPDFTIDAAIADYIAWLRDHAE
jgi:UDP-glucose 4-epimerase